MATSLDKDKIRVLLLEGVHDTAEETFRDAGYANVERRSSAVQGDELADLLDGSDGVLDLLFERGDRPGLPRARQTQSGRRGGVGEV